MELFDGTMEQREKLLGQLFPKLETYYRETKQLPVSSEWDVDEIRSYASAFDLESGNKAATVLDHVYEGLTKYHVHTPHPNYFGLFNPRAGYTSILADLITATFNPQMASWSHAPFANEIENLMIRAFGKRFGYRVDAMEGTFCAGGAESNLTAVLAALNSHFPDFNQNGVRGLTAKPVLYCSSESHHSIVKAAKLTGLGATAVRSIPVLDDLTMNTVLLKEQIAEDRRSGFQPFMIVGTAGTTGAGAIDDLVSLKEIATMENLWLHVDAAYGGALVASTRYIEKLRGTAESDSITLDLHKWFSVPMGTSLFLTSRKTILHRTFGIHTNYMPEDGDPSRVTDPYVNSIQWSRRFIGLKIFLPLAVHGWAGYQSVIDRQIEMGDLLRKSLISKGWEVRNQTCLPVICCTHADFQSNPDLIAKVVANINATGKVWVSEYPVRKEATIRICITNYLTSEQELEELIEVMEEVRSRLIG